MPTATWRTGETSGAAGGAGYGTGTWQTGSGYNPTTGSLVTVWVLGSTNGASTLTGGALSSVSVTSGTTPTMTQHVAGWVTSAGSASNWVPFCSMFYVNSIAACNGLRFTFDATDDIYQWAAVICEYTSQDTTTPFGRWGSDAASSDTADNEITTLDQNTGDALGAKPHVVGLIAADGAAGAIAVGTGFVERYESAASDGNTPLQVQDDQTSVDDTCEWGAMTPAFFEWVTLAVEVRDGGGGAPAPTYNYRRSALARYMHPRKR